MSNPLLDALENGAGALQSGIGAFRDVFTSPNITYAGNRQWAQPAPSGGYLTTLSPQAEGQFQQWVGANKVPFDPSANADYDMRGFWQGLMNKDPRAQSAINANDNQLHYPDYWKTPYHQSFSAESQWAKPNAPNWNDKDQLVTPDGRVIFDESKERSQ
jgi:hypothetical protein